MINYLVPLKNNFCYFFQVKIGISIFEKTSSSVEVQSSSSALAVNELRKPARTKTLHFGQRQKAKRLKSASALPLMNDNQKGHSGKTFGQKTSGRLSEESSEVKSFSTPEQSDQKATQIIPNDNATTISRFRAAATTSFENKTTLGSRQFMSSKQGDRARVSSQQNLAFFTFRCSGCPAEIPLTADSIPMVAQHVSTG